jgi:hypothetical protein
MTVDPQPRIWLALDALEHSDAPIGAALGLARLLQAELKALFIERDDLFRLAAFPQSFERRLFGSPVVREPASPTDELEQALRMQAAALHRQLGRAASATGVRWHFETARGRIVPQALDRAGAVDCVVVPAAAVATALAIAHRPVRVASPGSSTNAHSALRRQIWAAPGTGPRARRVLELAHRLLGGTSDGRLLMPDLPEAAASVRSWLRARGWLDEWREAGLDDLRQARLAPRGEDAGLLLLPRPDDAAERNRLESLWRRAGWPLVLV